MQTAVNVNVSLHVSEIGAMTNVCQIFRPLLGQVYLRTFRSTPKRLVLFTLCDWSIAYIGVFLCSIIDACNNSVNNSVLHITGGKLVRKKRSCYTILASNDQ